jgi:hypothetical protein
VIVEVQNAVRRNDAFHSSSLFSTHHWQNPAALQKPLEHHVNWMIRMRMHEWLVDE